MSEMPRRCPVTGRLSTRFMTLSVALLGLALVSIALTMYVTRQLDGGAAAVNEAGRLRMHAWRLTHALDSGSERSNRIELAQAMDASLSLLAQGDTKRPLSVPWNEDTRVHFDAVRSTWSSMRGQWLDGATQTGGVPLLDVARMVSETDVFIKGIETQMARLTATLNLFQLVLMGLALAAGVVWLYIGHLLVIQPLLKLRAALQQIEAGDFTVRVPSTSRDEFGQVAAGFNHMAQTLHTLYNGLEQKVREKTQDLESERQRLAALYEVSTFLAANHSMDALAQGFAQKIRLLSGADAAAVRWTDAASQRYLMLGSDCLPATLVRDEQCLKPGACECGQPQVTARTQTIPISLVPHPTALPCAEAGYVQLVSIPIRHQLRVLGEIDLFYRSEVALAEQDRALYEALAGHFANAVENLRGEALSRESAVSQERGLLARELHDSIAQSLAFLRIQAGLLNQGVTRRDWDTVQAAAGEIDTGVRESMLDVRELLVHFRTRTNSDDIEQALRTTLQKFEQQSGLTTKLELRGHGLSLPSDVQLQVLHVVQEALTNIRKHADASQVCVAVDKGPNWRFEVRDNGRGFQPVAAQASDTHVGLHIMRERAERIGAQVQVHSTPGQGTKVEILLGA